MSKKVSVSVLLRMVCLIVIIPLFIISCKNSPQEKKVEKQVVPVQEKKLTETPPKKSGNDIVVMHTNYGDVKLELFRDKAPITVENFLTYAKEKFYDGLIFHRVISNFMIQGGGFEQNCRHKQPTHPVIKNEATNGLSNVRGTIAMARTNQINSATSQFFINVKDNLPLDHKDMGAGFGYAVFGKVIEGMDVVDKIKNVSTGVNPKSGMRDWPKEDVIIESVEVL